MLNWVKKNIHVEKNHAENLWEKQKVFMCETVIFFKNVWQVTNIFSGERNLKTFFFSLCEKWGRKCFQVQCMKRTLNIFLCENEGKKN